MPGGRGLDLLLRYSGDRLSRELRGGGLEVAKAKARQRVGCHQRDRSDVGPASELESLSPGSARVPVVRATVRVGNRERNQLVANLGVEHSGVVLQSAERESLCPDLVRRRVLRLEIAIQA